MAPVTKTADWLRQSRGRVGRAAVLALAAACLAFSGGCATSGGTPVATPTGNSTTFGRITAPIDPSPWERLSTASGGVDSVTFVDSRRGWIVSGASLWATDDGGASWRVARGHIVDGGSGYRLPTDPARVPGAKQVLASDVRTIWLSYDTNPGGGLLVSRDGGRTWRSSYTADKDMSVLGYAWPDAQHGFMLIGRGDSSPQSLLRSVDAGLTWKQLHLWPAGASFAPSAPVVFADAQHGWLTGLGGMVATGDGGLSWQARIRPPGTTDKLTVSGAGALWAVGNYFSETSSDGMLAFSPNGGGSWENSRPFMPIPLFGVFFVDGQRGWIGAASTVYGTRDGGQTWAKELTVSDIAWIGGGFDLFARVGDRVLAIRDNEIYVRPL
jgi:photosystem II stability/assembly factor-like uncharacterized protein